MTHDDRNFLFDALLRVLIAVGGWLLQWRLARSHSAPVPATIGGGDVTVALTGVSAVCEAGHLTPKIEPRWCDLPPDSFFKACMRDTLAKMAEQGPLADSSRSYP